MTEGQYVRTTGWRMGLSAMETVPALPADHDEPEAMRLDWGPELVGDTVQYRVFNPKGHFDAGAVIDHFHIAGVGLEDGIEFASHEETQSVDEELWAGSSYEGAIGLPDDLPDGIYACVVTADCLRDLSPKPSGGVGFKVIDGAIQPV